MKEKETGPSPGAPYMSPLVKHDLARLDKDGQSRRSAMNSLKKFVENLDPGSMPRFLAQVSETRDQGVPRSYAISLYEEVARVHGKLVIPHIPRVMATVTRSLSSRGSSPQLHQACAKVVSAVARYSVEEGSPVQADEILRDLCDPLLSVLAGKLEPLAAGAAVCLQALVECEKWKYASDEIVNETCLRTTVALGERNTRTIAHMQLARSLATTNPSFFDSFGRALLRTGSEVLRQTSASSTWPQRACAARLLQAVLPIVDKTTLALELEHILYALDDCKHDRMAHVRSAVSEALKTAKVLSSHDGRINSVEELSCEFVENIRISLQSLLSLESLPGTFPSGSMIWKAYFRASRSYGVLAEENFPARNLVVNAGLSCDSRPSSGCSSCSGQAGKQDRLRPTSPEFQIPHPSLRDGKMGFDQQSSDTEASSFVMSKCRGGDAYSFLENSAITAHEKQDGVDILVDEVPSNGTTVNIEVETDIDPNQGLPTKESRYKQVGDTRDDNFGLVSTSRFSQRQTLSSGTSRKRACELEGSASDCQNQSVGAHAHNVDECLQASSGIFVSHDCKETSDFLRKQQSRRSSLLDLRSWGDVSSPQNQRALITSEDFLPFSTPRRLVHSLQSNLSSPFRSGPPTDEVTKSLHGGVDMPNMDLETSSEAGWSVRDNPIASDDSLKTDSEEEDSEQQGNVYKRMVMNFTTKNSPAELDSKIVRTKDCEKLSSAIVHAAESLFSMSPSKVLEHKCFVEDAEVLNDKLDHKVHDFCFSPVNNHGGLLSMVGEQCPSGCICSGKASNGTWSFEGGDHLLGRKKDFDTFSISGAQRDRIIGVLRRSFHHFLRDIFRKVLRSVQACTELLSTGFLCFILAVSFAMAVSKIVWSQLDRPGLIPT